MKKVKIFYYNGQSSNIIDDDLNSFISQNNYIFIDVKLGRDHDGRACLLLTYSEE